MSIRPFVMPFRLSCAYLIYDADAALPHLNPRKRRRGGIFIYEKRDHCIISCNSLFIFLINANLLTLAQRAARLIHLKRACRTCDKPFTYGIIGVVHQIQKGDTFLL